MTDNVADPLTREELIQAGIAADGHAMRCRQRARETCARSWSRGYLHDADDYAALAMKLRHHAWSLDQALPSKKATP